MLNQRETRMPRTGFSILGLAALFWVAMPESPVADAAMRGDTATVRELLMEGADVNAAQGDGMTALHWAARRGDEEMVTMVLYAGANVSAGTRIGDYTPLHFASQSGKVSILRKVARRWSADVSVVTTTGGATAMHLAAANGAAEALTLLIDRGGDPNRDGKRMGSNAVDVRGSP